MLEAMLVQLDELQVIALVWCHIVDNYLFWMKDCKLGPSIPVAFTVDGYQCIMTLIIA